MVTTSTSRKKTSAKTTSESTTRQGTAKIASNTAAKKPAAKKPVAAASASKAKSPEKKTTTTTAKKTSASNTESLPKTGKAIAAKPEITEGKAAKAAVVKTAPAKSNKKITVLPQERYRMIATAAFYLAECRGFTRGYEMEDWLTAEKEIDAKIRS